MALGVTAYSEAPFSAEESSVIVYPQGIGLTTNQNSVTTVANANVSVTGQALTGNLGTALGSSFVLASTTGQALTSTLGSVTEVPVGQQVNVTGFDLTVNVSNPTHDTLTAFGEAPFATLSPATFNIPVGIEATTGGILVGTTLPLSLGTVSVAADANTGTLTGQAMTMNEGQVAADDASAEVTGQTLTSSLGTAIGDANTIASPSGITMTMNEGQAVAPDASAEITGISFSAAIGTAVGDANTIASPSGIDLTMNEGQATADDASAELTGLALTITEGSAVGPVIWNPVNTGSAPIDPPGWKEVA